MKHRFIVEVEYGTAGPLAAAERLQTTLHSGSEWGDGFEAKVVPEKAVKTPAEEDAKVAATARAFMEQGLDVFVIVDSYAGRLRVERLVGPATPAGLGTLCVREHHTILASHVSLAHVVIEHPTVSAARTTSWELRKEMLLYATSRRERG